MTNANLPPAIASKFSVASGSLRDHWRLYIAEGIVLIILGTAAIIVPSFASLAIGVFLGWLFLVGGFVALVMTVLGRTAPGFWWSLLSSAVMIAVGTFLIGWPVSGVISLTLILTNLLIFDGLLTIMFAFEHRRQMSRRWGWLLVNGVLDLMLAGIIVWALPKDAMWALGLIIGIDMLFGGFSLITMALATRKHFVAAV
jgi:uncharacterized membrane protein HdeD (DUF308 family)